MAAASASPPGRQPGGSRTPTSTPLDRKLIDELAALRFVAEKTNLLLIGPQGVSKMMLAVAPPRQGVETGYRVYYTTAADLAARCHRRRRSVRSPRQRPIGRPRRPRSRRVQADRLPADPGATNQAEPTASVDA